MPRLRGKLRLAGRFQLPADMVPHAEHVDFFNMKSNVHHHAIKYLPEFRQFEGKIQYGTFRRGRILDEDKGLNVHCCHYAP